MEKDMSANMSVKIRLCERLWQTTMRRWTDTATRALPSARASPAQKRDTSMKAKAFLPVGLGEGLCSGLFRCHNAARLVRPAIAPAAIYSARQFSSTPPNSARRSNEEDLIWKMVVQQGIKARMREVHEVIKAKKVISLRMLRLALSSYTPEEQIRELYILSDLAEENGLDKFLAITYQVLLELYVKLGRVEEGLKAVESLKPGIVSVNLVNKYLKLRFTKKEDFQDIDKILDMIYNDWKAEHAVTTFNTLIAIAGKWRLDEESVRIVYKSLDYNLLPSSVMLDRILGIANRKNDYYLAAEIIEATERKGGGVSIDDYMELVKLAVKKPGSGKDEKIPPRKASTMRDASELVISPVEGKEPTERQRIALERLDHLENMFRKYKVTGRPFAGSVANVLIQLSVRKRQFQKALEQYSLVVEHRAALDSSTALCVTTALLS